MKTLLLTLVVVTMVCLDLGYTRRCYNQQSSQPKTTKSCPPGENSCYNKQWRDHRGSITERGCGCPKVKPGIKLRCCESEDCNN
nr:short chain neurotoxin [Laticauda colubrina]BAA75769.1 short chain neurotoxin [Laticauda colubrina]BAA75770.1 short chain neurotoxin [Laticauda colubrina]BAA75771.1 short chain neurotoxin [Laticauda colubrina]BAA75772.1 short chain neurotoxin [Laticauda colubrina]